MTSSVHIAVNGRVLRWARESIALDKTNASKILKIALTKLEQLESGQKTPTVDDLKAMSKTYKRTIATLLLKEPPLEKPLPKDRRTVNSEQLGHFHDKTILAVRKARAFTASLLTLKEENSSPLIHFNYKASLSEDPSSIAKRFREEQQLDEIRSIENATFALEAFIEKVESVGVAVFQLSLTQDNLRGFSLIDEPIPVIAIKRNEQTSAKVFTLFHELAHIILRDEGSCDINFSPDAQQIEKWCNAFAAELLVPADALLKQDIVADQITASRKEWDRKDLISIATKFHVGPLMILRRLLDLNLTTQTFYNQKHQLWNRPSFGRSKNPEGRNIAKETIKEKGRTYVHLAFEAFDNNKIDLKDLSDYLGVKLSYISKARQLLNF